MADLTDAQWVDEVIAVVAGLLDGNLTPAQAEARLTAATENWPTRTLSNADLAQRVSRFMARLNGLLLTNGPPPSTMGDLNTFAYDTTNGALYGPKTAQGWGTPVSLVGPPGPAVELHKSATHIQYRTIGAANWINLVALADLKGADGLNVSLRATATYIQWRLGVGEWADLISLAALRGADGNDGQDGQEISLQRTETHIQWRLGDGAWADLFALVDVKGDTGANGWTAIVANVVDGERRVHQVVDWVGGTGAKPATGKYVGPAGLVDTPAEATNMRGPGGSGSGDMMAANNLSELTDVGAARTKLEVFSKGEADSRFPVMSGGKIAPSALPALAITDVFEVGSQAAMLALTAQIGDIAIRSDQNRTYALAAEPPTDVANWKWLRTPTDVVLAVAGLTGTITAAALKAALSISAADVSGLPVKASGAGFRAGSNDTDYLTAKAVYDAFEQNALTPAQMAAGPDFDTFINATVVLNGNITIGAPVNAKPGKSGTIAIAQDATGGRQVAWNAAYRLPAGFSIQATANGLTMVPYQVGAGGVVRIFPPSKWA